MVRKAPWILALSLAILVVDFFTLENRLVTTNTALQKAGGFAAALAVAGAGAALVLLALGRASSRAVTEGAERPAKARGPSALGGPAGETGRVRRGPVPRGMGAIVPKMRLRRLKVVAGLAILASWLVVLPMMVHARLIVPASDYSAGPWVAEAFLSMFAVGAQLAAPTPMALAFWPSLLISAYFLLGRRDRPILDLLAGIAGAALVWLLFGVLAPR